MKSVYVLLIVLGMRRQFHPIQFTAYACLAVHLFFLSTCNWNFLHPNDMLWLFEEYYLVNCATIKPPVTYTLNRVFHTLGDIFLINLCWLNVQWSDECLKAHYDDGYSLLLFSVGITPYNTMTPMDHGINEQQRYHSLWAIHFIIITMVAKA